MGVSERVADYLYAPRDTIVTPLLPLWYPLWVESNFSFLIGASHPDELVDTALQKRLPGISLTDRDSVAGIVQAREALRRYPDGTRFQLIVGACVTISHSDTPGDTPIDQVLCAPMGHQVMRNSDGRIWSADPQTQRNEQTSSVLLIARTRDGYGNLCKLLTSGALRSPKGQCRVYSQEIRRFSDGLALIITEETREPDTLVSAFKGRAWVGISRHSRPTDQILERSQRRVAQRYSLPIVATPRIVYHTPNRGALQDVLTSIRYNRPLDDAGDLLLPNRTFGLPSLAEIYERYRDHPEWISETVRVVEHVQFRLEQIEYRYPSIPRATERNEVDLLRKRVREGAQWRYPSGIPRAVSQQLESELALIQELEYQGYFLTMTEIVDFCRSNGILCQGRGSAANSAVCYCLGITAIDPVKMQLLFERFISRERAEPPDIDLDIEHRRREEVIQYVYDRYGRDYAAMVSNTVRFKRRSAVREVGKAFGFSEVILDQFAKRIGYHGYEIDEAARRSGLDTTTHRVRRFIEIALEAIDTPRHRSIHPGGFLLGAEPIARIVPVENATMPDRTVIQWDKYAVEGMGLFKLDLLGLGALTHLDFAFRLLAEHLGIDLTIALIPRDCQKTFAMLTRAETVGVFQLESRAQMAMLPRMRPTRFYDLVIEISIVRPGPITGGMVHPYLRRRAGEEAVWYPHPDVEPILERTLGVPLFQEQVMKLAVTAANYTPGEADQLRRDMAAWRQRGRIEEHHHRIVEGMVKKGIERTFAEGVFEQIRGFGEYGFPESHAASFAQIAYATAWMRAHYPVIFTCALLNAWPMGFYSPSTIIHDAMRFGVEVRSVDILASSWECTLESRSVDSPHDATSSGDSAFAIRIGLRFIKGLGREDWERIRTIRKKIRVTHDETVSNQRITRFLSTLHLDRDRAVRLAEAGAFDSLGIDRRRAIWLAMGTEHPIGGNALSVEVDRAVNFRYLQDFERLIWDYRATGHSTQAHPMEPYRAWLASRNYPTASEVRSLDHDAPVSFIGMVICRQRPATASGTVFMTLEDETGFVNLIVWRSRYEAMKNVLLTTTVLGVQGSLQKRDGVAHLIVREVWNVTLPSTAVEMASRDFF